MAADIPTHLRVMFSRVIRSLEEYNPEGGNAWLKCLSVVWNSATANLEYIIRFFAVQMF